MAWSESVALFVDPSAIGRLHELDALDPTDLTELRILTSKVRDGDIKPVSRLRGLECLSLGHSHVTDAVLDHLRSLPGLLALRLQDTLITDYGLELIGSMFPSLRTLWIGGTLITDAGTTYLHRLKNLTELSFDDSYGGRRTKVSTQAIVALQRSLKGCRIELPPMRET